MSHLDSRDKTAIVEFGTEYLRIPVIVNAPFGAS
jgi:hypothetical protein